MKNILFYGPYRQNDGWGEASYRYLECLVNTDHNIQAIFTKLGQNEHPKDIDKKIIEAEQRQIEPDIIIYYVLPQLLDISKIDNKKAKHVLFFHFETQTLTTDIIEKISKFDLVLVSTIVEKYILYSYNIDSVVCVPCPINTKQYKNLEQRDTRTYKFYTVGEFVERKNIISLIHAFISTFSDTDDVSLTIKSNIKLEQFSNILYNITSIARKAHNLQNCPTINYIESRLSNQEMMQFHYDHDCFVSISHGESICLPLIDALIIGNKAIVTGQTGMDDHVGDTNVNIVDGFSSPCYVKSPPLANIYSCNDFWITPNTQEFMTKMRNCMNLSKDKTPSQMTKEKHSKKKITKQLFEIFNDL